MLALAFLFGVMLAKPIGSADMSVVMSLLNSYAGLAAAATGFVLGNTVPIIAGTLDGFSGFILSVPMRKAMNLSITNVLFGGFGAVIAESGPSNAGGMMLVTYDNTGKGGTSSSTIRWSRAACRLTILAWWSRAA
jgi:NAD(P) transhydrogenase subunit beta